MLKSLYYNLLEKISLKFGAYTAATNGQVIVDRKGYESVKVIIASGTVTDGTGYEFELKEGDASDLSDAAAVADSDLIGSEPTFAATDDDKVKVFEYIGKKRYLRVDLKTVSGSPTTGGVFGGIVQLGNPRHAPVA